MRIKYGSYSFWWCHLRCVMPHQCSQPSWIRSFMKSYTNLWSFKLMISWCISWRLKNMWNI
jgi:hypothetical protein